MKLAKWTADSGGRVYKEGSARLQQPDSLTNPSLTPSQILGPIQIVAISVFIILAQIERGIRKDTVEYFRSQ